MHLAVLVGTEVMYVEIVRSRDAPRMPSEVGGRLPAHAAGVGKAMLAFSPEAVVQAVIDHRPAGRRSADDHRPRAAAAGIAPDPGTRASPTRARNPGTASAARPARSSAPDGHPVAAMSISGWSGKLDLRRVGPAVKTAALALSRE